MIISKTAITKWNNFTKSYYEEKGYIYTNRNEEFEVKVEDLKPSSTVMIRVKCDYCGREKEVGFNDYVRSTKNFTQKYACDKCGYAKQAELHFNDRQNELQMMYKKLIDCMTEKGYITTCSFEDFHNAYSKMTYICPLHG